MQTSRHFILVMFTLLLLHSGYASQAQTKKQAREVRVDQYGDPLPKGAIARLGTLRFVHLGGISAVAVSPDGKIVASGVRDRAIEWLNKYSIREGMNTTIRLWNSATGKMIQEIDMPDAPVSHIAFGTQNKYIFAGCGKYIGCWDVSTRKKRWQQEAIQGEGFRRQPTFEKIVVAKDKLISVNTGVLQCEVKIGSMSAYYYHQQNVIRMWNRYSKQGQKR